MNNQKNNRVFNLSIKAIVAFLLALIGAVVLFSLSGCNDNSVFEYRETITNKSDELAADIDDLYTKIDSSVQDFLAFLDKAITKQEKIKKEVQELDVPQKAQEVQEKFIAIIDGQLDVLKGYHDLANQAIKENKTLNDYPNELEKLEKKQINVALQRTDFTNCLIELQ